MRPPGTSCQFRADIERMFPLEKDRTSSILYNVGFSYVNLHGDMHAANRFHLGDLWPGTGRTGRFTLGDKKPGKD